MINFSKYYLFSSFSDRDQLEVLTIWFDLCRVVQWVRQLDYLTTHTSLSPIQRGFASGFVNYKKGCTWLDKVYQLLAHGRWFSPGTQTSSTTKTNLYIFFQMIIMKATDDIIINVFWLKSIHPPGKIDWLIYCV
jgi:hypothetical protein